MARACPVESNLGGQEDRFWLADANLGVTLDKFIERKHASVLVCTESYINITSKSVKKAFCIAIPDEILSPALLNKVMNWRLLKRT